MKTKRKKPFYKKWWVWLIAIIVIAAASSGGGGGGGGSSSYDPSESSIPLPDSQLEFLKVVQKAQNEANAAQNEMKMGVALKGRTQDLPKVLPSLSVTDWIGTITRLDTADNGKGVLSVSIGDDISVKTWNNGLSDTGDKTLLDGELLNKVADYSRRDKVEVLRRIFPKW